MDEKIYVIDRIEGSYAICVPDDGGENLSIPAELIPNAAECMRLAIGIDGDKRPVIRVLPDNGKKEENHKRLRNLFNKSESGKNED